MTQAELRFMTSVPNALNDIAKRLGRTPDIDWEQRRYELAKAAITGVVHDKFRNKDYVARAAVAYADAVIRELKKTSNETKD